MDQVRLSRLSPPGLRFLAFMIAWYARDDGSNAFPSVRSLMEDTGYEERTVREGLQKLRDSGVLIVESAVVEGRRGPQPAGGRSTLYRFDFEALGRAPKIKRKRSLSAPEPCGSPQGLERIAYARALPPTAENGAAHRTESCSPPPETVRSTAGDPSGSVRNKRTGATRRNVFSLIRRRSAFMWRWRLLRWTNPFGTTTRTGSTTLPRCSSVAARRRASRTTQTSRGGRSRRRFTREGKRSYSSLRRLVVPHH